VHILLRCISAFVLLPQKIRLIDTCSPEPHFVYDVDSQALGRRFHRCSREKNPRNGEFIYTRLPETRPHLSPKMSDYYTRETPTTDADTGPGPIIPEAWGEPSYMSLPAKYQLDDMEIGIDTCNLGQNRPTVEQEYLSYVTPPFSVQSNDPLKFWEVGSGINGG